MPKFKFGKHPAIKPKLPIVPQPSDQYLEDTEFLDSYFDQVARLLDPKTGQPRNTEAYNQREHMRRRLTQIRKERYEQNQ